VTRYTLRVLSLRSEVSGVESFAREKKKLRREPWLVVCVFSDPRRKIPSGIPLEKELSWGVEVGVGTGYYAIPASTPRVTACEELGGEIVEKSFKNTW